MKSLINDEHRGLIGQCKEYRKALRRERAQIVNGRNPRYLPQRELARVWEIDIALEEYSDQALADKFECGIWTIKNA